VLVKTVKVKNLTLAASDVAETTFAGEEYQGCFSTDASHQIAQSDFS